MARKQARKRKPQKKRVELKMPRVNWGRILKPVFAVALVLITYDLSTRLLERPVKSIEIMGPMQRVSVLEIEDAIEPEIEAGFFASDLERMRERIQSLQWIDQAAVARRWPNRIAISVTEQVPAAVWGESGLMNVRGELFVDNGAQHMPAELPRLSGPDHRAVEVARRYLDIRRRLVPAGIDVKRVSVDARGAWEVTLSNGINVRLGRRDVDERTELLVTAVADFVTVRGADIEFVDVRYDSGFSIGWKDDSRPDPTNPGAAREAMLASSGVN
ncbi:MAG: cell division protein FtsQ/DivIB [Woeseiaceae bacterium]|nr:cell division protein FtsQ/DivIB [Woeseiaceae bacterium]